MGRTANYDLYTETNDATKFNAWREAMNGGNNCNMTKIDNALYGLATSKAAKSSSVTATLLRNGWSGNGPYTQTISVSELGEDQNGSISVAHGASAAQREAAREAMLAVSGQGNGTLTIVADGEMPDVDIPVEVILLG